MIYARNEALRQEVFDNIREIVVKDREGTHLSDCIYCIRKSYFRKIGATPPPDDETCLLWLTGYAFQAYMFPLDEEQTLIVEGISCSPDVIRGVEVKTTRQSMKKFDFQDQILWQRQILGYCKALGKLEYDLAVMFICGGYSPPFPDIDCWHIIANQQEVDDNWALIKENANTLEQALASGIPPEPTCLDFEWKYCECVDLCPDTYCYRMKHTGRRKK